MSATARAGSMAIGLLVALSCMIGWPTPADAHRDGCHRHHSCPSDSGSYVCGDTGNFSECGYTSLPEEPEAPVFDYDAPNRPKVSTPKTRAGAQLAVTVIAERGAKVVIRSGGKTLFKTTATGSRQTLRFTGRNGSHSYSVRATDSSGNASSLAKFTATADGVAPSVEDVAVTNGTPQNALTQLTFAAGEAAKYTVLVDGRRVTSGRANADDKRIGFAVPNGRHKLILKLKDATGNVSTFKRSINIKVPQLAPVLETLTEPNEATQRFSIVGTPGSTGTLTVAGKSVPVQLKTGATEIAVDLADGEYSAGTLVLRDQVGRRGSAEVASFTVDTAIPEVEVVRVDDGSTTGRLVARITAEKGARVAWQVEDAAGDRLERAAYVATGAARTVDVDTDEGVATLAVSATDGVGNSATDTLEADIAADPLTVTDWLIVVIVLLLVVSMCLLLWRRRDAVRRWLAAKRHLLEVRRARRAHEAALRQHARDVEQYRTLVAVHEQRLAEWDTRDRYLAELHDEARSTTGSAPTDVEHLGVRVIKGERIFSVVAGSLLEERTRQNVATLVEVERGRVTITNLRVLFQGQSKKREWAYDKLERIIEHNHDATLMAVSNRKTLSGVSYADPERTRVHLMLALDPSNRQQAVDEVAALRRSHQDAQPVAPPPPPSAPQPPAILQGPTGFASVPV